MKSPGRIHAAAAVIALISAACGSTVADTTTSSSPSPSSTIAAGSTTTSESTSTTSQPPTTSTTEIQGDPVVGGPRRGAVLAVVGVAHDDVLNLRSSPGADQPVLAGIPPTYDEVVALGNTRSLPTWWVEVVYEATVGWVNVSYLAYAGATSDITADVLERLEGPLTEVTMTELGAAVAGALASEEPRSDIVLVVGETLGDLGEITYDVIGLGDDAVRGVRLHVFGEPTGSGFTLRTVESTVLCDPVRGVDEDGTCV